MFLELRECKARSNSVSEGAKYLLTPTSSYLHGFRHLSSLISTRIISSPILRIHSNGIIYSASYPRNPQILPGPGTINASTHPEQILICRSATNPSRLQSHMLMTSRSFNPQNRIRSSFILHHPSDFLLYYMNISPCCQHVF